MPRVPTNVKALTGTINRTTTRVPVYARERTLNRQLDSIQEIAAAGSAAARAANQDSFVRFQDVSFTAGQTKAIGHMLGRNYQGFRVERMRGTHPISLKEVVQSSSLDSKQITLNSNTACTVDVVVY